MRFELMRIAPADFESAALTTRPNCHIDIEIQTININIKYIHILFKSISNIHISSKTLIILIELFNLSSYLNSSF